MAPVAADDTSVGPLTAAQVAAWRSSGVVVLQPGLLPPGLLAEVRTYSNASFSCDQFGRNLVLSFRPLLTVFAP